MHVKGLEMPGYEPRGLKTMALGLAVSPRGACHNRSAAYEADFSGAVDRFAAEIGRGRIAAEAEDLAAVLDSLIVCKFIRKCFDDLYAEAAELYEIVTGRPTSGDDLRLAGERITTLKKLFNVRVGLDARRRHAARAVPVRAARRRAGRGRAPDPRGARPDDPRLLRRARLDERWPGPERTPAGAQSGLACAAPLRAPQAY